jgi:CheY-like chemotaxis protein
MYLKPMPSKLYILSVDDDADDQDLLEEALKLCQFPATLERESDGVALLKKLNDQLKKGEKHPDLILLDLNMPIKGGKETLVELKAMNSSFKTIPIVIYSTSSAGQDITFCMENGAQAFVVKPTKFGDLVQEMEKTFMNCGLPQRLINNN